VGTQYLVPDHLGSTRLILNAQGACAQRLDYAPFGAQLTRPGAACYTTPATGLPLFTGQVRDPESAAGTETGLDYFNARYFWATLGRFTSPDAPFADQYPEDPQSWNLYGYGRSNPLAFIDPTGRCKKGADSMYHDSEEGPCVAPGGTSITVGADDDEPLSPYAMVFYNEMSRRRMASNQMIVAVAGGSAAVGTAGGVATATGAVAATIDGVAYTWAELAALRPEVLAKLAAAGKIGHELLARLQVAIGPLSNWVRVGPSYSHHLRQRTMRSIRWGASPARGGIYVNQIGNPTLRDLNQWLRSQRIPVPGWRAADPGHFHLKK
jgi:RHS repeat-associated protein